MYVRREKEFALHLHACKQMMPYFFAAGHINYVRYGICYLRSMEKLPGDVLASFMKGDHVMRHQDGLWNGIWVDMMIETTFMRYGKGPGGIIGVTTKPKTVSIWANSLHSCNEVLKDLDDVRERDSTLKTHHKEELIGRINADENDRKKLRDFLKTCVHPLDIDSHDLSSGLLNIYTGGYAPKHVNVNKAVKDRRRATTTVCTESS